MGVQRLEEQRADHSANQAAGNQETQKFAVEVFPENRQSQQVNQQQHRYQDGRCLRHRNRQRHQRHRQRTKAGAKTALADAHQKHCRNRHGIKKRVGDERKVHARLSTPVPAPRAASVRHVQTQISLLDFRASQHLTGLALGHDTAFLHDVGATGNVHRHRHVLLDQQHRRPG